MVRTRLPVPHLWRKWVPFKSSPNARTIGLCVLCTLTKLNCASTKLNEYVP